jgi:hypothetical protein
MRLTVVPFASESAKPSTRVPVIPEQIGHGRPPGSCRMIASMSE